MKLITSIFYRPIGIVMGILAGLLGKRIFDYAWGKVDHEDAPKPNTKEVSWPKVLAAAALQGVIFKTVRAAVDRSTAKTFYNLTGAWPGDERPKPE